MSSQIRSRLEYLKKHNLLEKQESSASRSNAVVIRRRCGKCNSPRNGFQCWKCNTETFIPDESWEELKTPSVDRIRELAREAGYGIGEHGSKERDLDLIAAPWVDDCIDQVELIVHIADGLNGRIIGEIEKKPNGRLACNIQMDGWYKIIDLSVCPVLE